MSEKRKRGQNFTTDEKDRLIKLLVEHKDTILNKRTDGATNEAKSHAWITVTNTFNTAGTIYRSKDSLMKMWEKLRSDSKIYFTASRRDSTQTGGGPSVIKIDPILEQVCAILGRGCTGIIGVQDSDSVEEIKIFPEVQNYPKVICIENENFPTETINVEFQEVESNINFFILFTGLISSVTTGFMLSFPSVLTPAITSRNSTDIKTTSDHASWITAVNGIGGMFGCFIVIPTMQILGRKACHIILNAFWLIGWVIFIFAENITALYAARFIQGFSTSGNYLNAFIISEYVHPFRRGYFIGLKKVAIATGVLGCHAMSAFCTWRKIALFAGAFSFLAILLTYFWPESPSHLLLKSKFEECERSFKWLNGNGVESQKQLKSLMDAQREKTINKTEKNGLLNLVKKFTKKDFQKAFVISSLLTMSIDLCGRYYYMAYMIQIMKELMGNNSSALYFTLGADLLTLIAVSTSAVFMKYANRRTILFSTGASSVLLMLFISVLVYLKSVYTFSTPVLWFTALMVVLQSFVVNIGLIPVAITLISEIFPLEHKGLGSFTSCFVFSCMYAAVLKMASVLMEHTKLYGTFAIFGVLLAVCMIVLYKIVPETKDKTLQEIEDELKDVRRKDIVLERQELMIK